VYFSQWCAHISSHYILDGQCTVQIIHIISIILMLYSPCYPVNIKFQGTAAKLSYFFRVLFVKFYLAFVYFLMSTSQNYTKTIIHLRLSEYWQILPRLPLGKYSPIFTLPSGNNCLLAFLQHLLVSVFMRQVIQSYWSGQVNQCNCALQ